MDLRTSAARIGALADESRLQLYAYVAAQTEPVGREQASKATGIALHNASFHLDRLAAEGLLDVEYRRLSGRTGPGAGRPSKLYRRSAREIEVSLPPRRYDVVGQILAEAVSRAQAGAHLSDALEQSAHAEGSAVAKACSLEESPADAAARPFREASFREAHRSREAHVSDADQARDPGATIHDLERVLGIAGFEASRMDDALILANCPFHQLAQQHTELICGLNRAFVQGMADALGLSSVDVRLEPERGHCCVRTYASTLSAD